MFTETTSQHQLHCLIQLNHTLSLHQQLFLPGHYPSGVVFDTLDKEEEASLAYFRQLDQDYSDDVPESYSALDEGNAISFCTHFLLRIEGIFT
jgi:hypothetical protein